MKFITTILIFVFSTGLAMTTHPTGKVVKVIDGNTIEVEFPDKETETYILKYVDAPELSQAYGQDAKEFLEKMVLKKKITILSASKDRWGNRLALIELKNGIKLNDEVLKNGLGWYKDRDQNETLIALEQNAKDKKIGLWTQEAPMEPWVFKRKKSMTTAKAR